MPWNCVDYDLWNLWNLLHCRWSIHWWSRQRWMEQLTMSTSWKSPGLFSHTMSTRYGKSWRGLRKGSLLWRLTHTNRPYRLTQSSQWVNVTQRGRRWRWGERNLTLSLMCVTLMIGWRVSESCTVEIIAMIGHPDFMMHS